MEEETFRLRAAVAAERAKGDAALSAERHRWEDAMGREGIADRDEQALA